MVPKAWLNKKRCFFGNLYLIITFTMHSLSMLGSFISMKCCWSIGDRNCHSLDYRVEPSSCFYEKVHQVKLKYGSNHLAKNWGKRWIELHRCSVYYQTHLGLLMSLLLPVSLWPRCHGPCWKSKLIQPHVQHKNSQYFNCESFTYIHVFLLVALPIAFFPWKPNCNHYNQMKEYGLRYPYQTRARARVMGEVNEVQE